VKNSPMPPRKKRLENKKPLKPGGQIERRTRLRAVKEVPPGIPGQKETPNRPKPAKKPAGPKSPPKKVVDLVKARSGGFCEIGLRCLGEAPATERAHRMGKGIGGAGSKGRKTSDAPADLLDACRADHDLLDRVAVAESYLHGYKVRHGAARPSEVPVQHFRLGWVLLDDAGGWRPAPKIACTPGALLPVVTCGPWDSLTGGGAIREALDRFGHTSCTGLAGVRGGLLLCGCGSLVAAVVEVAS
jgi:hypothetical protein